MNKRRVNETHLHISITTKIPITRKASDSEFKTSKENMEHMNV